LGDSGLITLREDLDPFIRQVSDRARNAQPFGLAHRVVAEAHALHLARDRVMVSLHEAIIKKREEKGKRKGKAEGRQRKNKINKYRLFGSTSYSLFPYSSLTPPSLFPNESLLARKPSIALKKYSKFP
jgi:hypothetical protein